MEYEHLNHGKTNITFYKGRIVWFNHRFNNTTSNHGLRFEDTDCNKTIEFYWKGCELL